MRACTRGRRGEPKAAGAARDAIHIGAAAVHGVDILLTWNCQHIANAAIMRELGEVVADSGFQLPILGTPEELLGE